MKVVIIGANACGAKTACRLKRLKPDWEVILIDKEEEISYGACGIPYYISGEIPDENALRETSFRTVRDKNFFENAKGIKVLTKTLAEKIDRKNKKVYVKNLETGKQEEISYDKLVIATGSIPKILPIPGVELEGVYTISNLESAIKIKKKIAEGKIEKAIIIGAGFIGLEMAEAFGDLWGIPVVILEYFSQVMPKILPKELAKIVEHHLKEKGVEVVLNARIKEIIGKNGKVCGVKMEDGKVYEGDLVLLAVGVKPNSELAKKAGLLVSPITEGIIVNERMQTSDPDIYAGGDCVEIRHLITGKKVVMPMGSLANRQGRVIANNIAGEFDTFPGTVGAFILKCFDLAIGGCGLTLETAKSEGFSDVFQALNNQSERSHFYPGAEYAFYSLTYEKQTGKVLGFHAVGPFTDGTLARVHAISSILPFKPTIKDLIKLELAYAPPFNSALDPIHDTAHTAENQMNGRYKVIELEDFLKLLNSQNKDWLFIDVRHPKESAHLVEKYENYISIRYEEFRQKAGDLPMDKKIVILCSTSRRSYEIARYLLSKGYKEVFVLNGGLNFYLRWGLKF